MITKEQWVEIEKELSGFFGHAKFKLGSDEISVIREPYKEGERRLVVYLNGWIRYGWNADPTSENYNLLIEKFYQKHSRALYSGKEKKRLSKGFRKKELKEYFPGLEKRYTYFSPCWRKAKTLVNQFKKIKELELLKSEPSINF